jgi:hypothetical protein
LRGVKKMKEAEQIEKLLMQVEKTNLQNLMNQSLNGKDPLKKQVLHALYTYALDKKQDRLLKNKKFVI